MCVNIREMCIIPKPDSTPVTVEGKSSHCNNSRWNKTLLLECLPRDQHCQWSHQNGLYEGEWHKIFLSIALHCSSM